MSQNKKVKQNIWVFFWQEFLRFRGKYNHLVQEVDEIAFCYRKLFSQNIWLALSSDF